MNTPGLKMKLSKSIDFLKGELAQIRTGRASPTILENLVIDAYDSKMTLKELGSIAVSDAQTLTISTWDKSLTKIIANAIRDSELKLNPVVDGDLVRVPIPALTEDRRKDFVKLVSAKVEDCKNSMRSIRQDAMKEIEKDFTDKKIGEDDKFSEKEEVEKVIKEFAATAEELGDSKKQELMKI